jgi:biopolymer transport protein ExbD
MDNQFKNWVRFSRIVNPQLRIAIKADQALAYPIIKNVMNTLQDLDENRYNLITSLEQSPDKKSLNE